jgi:hypothetical protein
VIPLKNIAQDAVSVNFSEASLSLTVKQASGTDYAFAANVEDFLIPFDQGE